MFNSIRKCLCVAWLSTSLAAMAQPAITVQPVDQSVSLGANVTFSVTASGAAPLSYHWLFNGDGIANATNRTLRLTNALMAMDGVYSVVITNSSGSSQSRLARLEVDSTFTKITSGAIVTDMGDGESMA